MKLLLALIFCSVTATSLAAHPHIFVNTKFELIVDDGGQLTDVRVIWDYDELYSLLITEDNSLDPDGDGLLTGVEILNLKGFDTHWSDGFNGDLIITNDDTRVTLSGPRDITVNFAEGRITTTHLRALKKPILPGETATIKAYDPTYYTAYEVIRPVTVVGAGFCNVRLKVPKPNSKLMGLQQRLAALEPQMDPLDAGLPDIGSQMATSVVVTCDAS